MSDSYDPLAAYATPSWRDRAAAAFKQPAAWLCLLLAAAPALLYLPFLNNPLVFDDKPFFVEAALNSFAGTWHHFNLRWLTFASFGWTYAAVGLDWPWYRAGNLALHAATVLLAFGFFARLFRLVLRDENARAAWLTPAFAGALLFALHPIAVYGVAYLVERSIVMATLFGLASLWLFLEGMVRERGNRWFVAAALAYLLAVFSKEHSIMLPAVALMLVVLLQRPLLPALRRLWLPFALYGAIALLVLARNRGLLGAPYEPFAAEMLQRMSEQQPQAAIAHAYPLSVLTQATLFFKYLLLWLLPYPGWLSVDLRQPFAASMTDWPYLLGATTFLAYAVLAFILLRKGGHLGLLGFGLLFPWLLFFTELSTVRIQEPFVLYRSYLWLSGLPALLPWLLRGGRWQIPAAAAIAVLLAALSWNRLDTFSSSLKLWDDAVAKNRDATLLGTERAYNNRGIAHADAGALPEAIADYSQALQLQPRYADAYLNLGIAYFRLQRWPEALDHYRQALALKPDYANVYQNRGVVYLSSGEVERALADFQQAVRLQSWDATSWLNQGMAQLRLGRPQQALDNLNHAIALAPHQGKAYMNRAIIHAMQGRADDAQRDFDRAVQLAPGDAEVYYNRANLYALKRQPQQALLDFDQAIRLDARYADAYVNRGGVYMSMARPQDALRDFNEALAINPDHENARLNRGLIAAALKQYQDAMTDYDRVLALRPEHPRALLQKAVLLQAMNQPREAGILLKRSCALGERLACGKS